MTIPGVVARMRARWEYNHNKYDERALVDTTDAIKAAIEELWESAGKWGRARFCQTCANGRAFFAPTTDTCPWCHLKASEAREAKLRNVVAAMRSDTSPINWRERYNPGVFPTVLRWADALDRALAEDGEGK